MGKSFFDSEIAVVGLVLVGGYALYKLANSVGTGITDIAQGISNIGTGLGSGVNKLGTGLSDIGTGLGGGLLGIGTGVQQLGSGLGNLGTGLGSGLNYIGAGVYEAGIGTATLLGGSAPANIIDATLHPSQGYYQAPTPDIISVNTPLSQQTNNNVAPSGSSSSSKVAPSQTAQNIVKQLTTPQPSIFSLVKSTTPNYSSTNTAMSNDMLAYAASKKK